MKAIKFLFSVLCALAVMQAVLGEAQRIVRIAPTSPSIVMRSPVLPPVIPSAGPYFIPGPQWMPGFIPGQQFFNYPAIVQPFVISPVQPFMNAYVQPFVPYGSFTPPQSPVRVVNPNRDGHRQRVASSGVPGVVVQPPQSHIMTPPQVSVPPPGTARAQVIGRLGHPLGSALTRDGETLYYGSGITVFIQNGQVAHPKRNR